MVLINIKLLNFQFCHRTENENEKLVHKMLGEKFVEQIEQLRFGILKSMPIRESSQVNI